MALRVAFAGFRHAHLNGLYALLSQRTDTQVVAACEEDEEARVSVTKAGIRITHRSFEQMLGEVPCDVVVSGDYFSTRGRQIIAALEKGCHVMGDKPLCTRLDELDRIETLATKKGLRVGCMLDLVDAPQFQTLHRLLGEGAAGEAHSICFDGKHPLNYGTRPGWYFEEGKHGGTINDLAIHAIDAIPWLTGRAVVEVTAARAWNARFPERPHFQDGAVIMLRLDNGGAVLGDLSYLTPEGQGYSAPSYWRFTIAGTGGIVETSYTMQTVNVYRKEKSEPIEVVPGPARHGGYWEDFLADLAGHPLPGGLHTARVISSTRITLQAQAAADTGRFPVPVREV